MRMWWGGRAGTSKQCVGPNAEGNIGRVRARGSRRLPAPALQHTLGGTRLVACGSKVVKGASESSLDVGVIRVGLPPRAIDRAQHHHGRHRSPGCIAWNSPSMTCWTARAHARNSSPEIQGPGPSLAASNGAMSTTSLRYEGEGKALQ